MMMLLLTSSLMYVGCAKEEAELATVTTAAITASPNGTAVAGGNVTDDGGADVTARGVCYASAANPTISDSKTSDGTGVGAFTSNLSQLAPGATYHARAYATNSEGTAYGADVMFTVPL